MNNDIVEGRWKQLRGNVKTWWGKLTDGDLDQLVGMLQEKYGYTREKAGDEIERRLQEYDQKHSEPA